MLLLIPQGAITEKKTCLELCTEEVDLAAECMLAWRRESQMQRLLGSYRIYTEARNWDRISIGGAEEDGRVQARKY
jgi:hypothetical protein